MAEVVPTEEFEFTRPKTPRPETYPWADWLNGMVWKLEHGVDFGGKDPNVFRNTVAAAASRHGLKSRTSLRDGKYLYIQAFEPSQEENSSESEKGDDAVGTFVV